MRNDYISRRACIDVDRYQRNIFIILLGQKFCYLRGYLEASVLHDHTNIYQPGSICICFLLFCLFEFHSRVLSNFSLNNKVFMIIFSPKNQKMMFFSQLFALKIVYDQYFTCFLTLKRPKVLKTYFFGFLASASGISSIFGLKNYIPKQKSAAELRKMEFGPGQCIYRAIAILDI